LLKPGFHLPHYFWAHSRAAITFKLAPTQELLKGFSNQGMLTVGVLYLVAGGMYATGAITAIMDKLIGRPTRLMSAQMKILPPIAVGSAFLNNTPLVAMMIPVIRDLTHSTRLSARQLYLPVSFASILGGQLHRHWHFHESGHRGAGCRCHGRRFGSSADHAGA